MFLYIWTEHASLIHQSCKWFTVFVVFGTFNFWLAVMHTNYCNLCLYVHTLTIVQIVYINSQSQVTLQWPISILYISHQYPPPLYKYSTHVWNRLEYYSGMDVSNKYEYKHSGRHMLHRKRQTQTWQSQQNKGEIRKYSYQARSYNTGHSTGNSREVKAAVQTIVVTISESNSGARGENKYANQIRQK